MGNKQKKGKPGANAVPVPVSTAPYTIRTGTDFTKGVKSLRRIAEDFTRVEQRRREEGAMRT